MDSKIEIVLGIFTEINNIPRKSKNEKAISDWLYNWGMDKGFEVQRDELLDILIRVPATPGYEDLDTIILQGHMDMVCEKVPDSKHDFSVDSIKMYRDKGWLKAKETSLGADNGIALAIALALATDSEVVHPELEFLFTVDEETGLTGAVNLSGNWLKGRKLINIDSEEEGVFTIGCAGGRDAKITLPRVLKSSSTYDSALLISIVGLKGGHSGVEIHLEKANSNILLVRVLKELDKNGLDYGLVELSGGSAHNAIPRNSKGTIAVRSKDVSVIKQHILILIEQIKNEYKCADPDIGVEIEEVEFNGECSDKTILNLIQALPNGVMYNSMEMKDLVETSSNLAVISTTTGEYRVLMSQRSSIMSRLDEICNKIDAVVRLCRGSVEFGGGYSAWQPDFDSKILNDFKECYFETFKKDPNISVLHAGLECGVIGAKYPGMEMISIGPTIVSPHCPDEKMLISTIGDIWKLLVNYLKIKL